MNPSPSNGQKFTQNLVSQQPVYDNGNDRRKRKKIARHKIGHDAKNPHACRKPKYL